MAIPYAMNINNILGVSIIALVIALLIHRYFKQQKKKIIVGYISALYTYPVKSAGSVTLQSVEVNQLGFKHNRQYVLVNEYNKIVKFTRNLQLLKLKQRITEENILLQYEGMKDLYLPLSMKIEDGVEKRYIEVLGLTTFGVHVSEEADAWFSKLLNTEGIKLFCYPTDGVPRYSFDLGVNINNYKNDKETNMFANNCPILLVSDSSISFLEGMINEEVTAEHFRPSIVVSGSKAFAEENWGLIEINNVQLQALYPAPRCPNINVDPLSCNINNAILKGLKEKRPGEELGFTHPKMKSNGLFGMYFGVRREGTINVGDEICLVLN